jgi:hypothetical protein
VKWVLFLLLGGTIHAQDALRAWKYSLIPLAGSQVLDATSSYGARELNPILASPNGGFETKALSIKLVATGAVVGVEWLIVRKYPRSEHVLTRLNWVMGVTTTGFAIHNYVIR